MRALDGAPVDIGNGLVSASLGAGGAWLSLGAPHPRCGFVELTALPPFEPAWRGDPDAVRRYREFMAAPVFAFLTFEVAGAGLAERRLLDGSGTTVRERRVAHHRHEIVARARAGEPCVEQRHRLVARDGSAPQRVIVRFRGRLDVHPLPEITETDPPPPSRARTRLLADGERLVVDAPALPARAEVRVALRGAASTGWSVAGDGAQLIAARGRGEREALELVVTCALWGEGAAAPRERAPRRTAPARGRPLALFGAAALHVPPPLRGPLEELAARAESYVLGCTAVRVARGEVCLLTDHRILPLSWTRDAYWQAALLLARGVAFDVVAAHLRWLWRRCERPHALWARSHHANGAVKDAVFQADQQLYPLLELADYRCATGELPAVPEGAAWWAGEVRRLWEALPIAPLGLLPTAENPADDRSELPYPLSSQILLWLAARRLADLEGELATGLDFGAAARTTAAAIRRHFEADGPWAYEVDGRGGRRLYHDANDLPTALAPLLGFCSAADPAWIETMRFAFSERNAAYRPGAWGGLGSLHTPGTWTLGDLQEWVAASLLAEPERAERALGRLLAVAGPTGLLPEAYDSATGRAPVRRWFAWPGAALGALLGTPA